MKLGFLVVASSVCFLFPCHGFVAKYTSGGRQTKWDLTTLPSSVPTNSVNRQTKAIRYFLGAEGYSTTNTAAELNSIRASFGQWQAIAGTNLKFEEAGLVSNPDVNLSNNVNVVYWSKTNLVQNFNSDISGRLGTAFISFGSDGTIVQGDIVLNGFENGWFTDFTSTSNPLFFPEGVLVHEIGHFLGLDHSPVGGASMLHAGEAGVNIQSGLSLDEIAAAHSLYPATNVAATLGGLRGQVTTNGIGILGAVVIVENAFGNIVSGTVARPNGLYDLPALAPGSYGIRVTPLDSVSASNPLLRGNQIATGFVNAVTSFLPTTNRPVVVTAGTTNTQDFAVTSGTVPFHIGWIRKPSANSGSYSIIGLPVSIYPGQSNRFVGVFSPNLPTNNATLKVTGDGITLGSVSFHPRNIFSGLNGISVQISIASNATPGLRSFIVEQGNNRAYANGFIEVLPIKADYNFDGVDDVFQRQHFEVFTALEAGSSADPDGDGVINFAESIAATDPRDGNSFLKLVSVQQDLLGTVVTWRSVLGKRYQVQSRSAVGSGQWVAVGAPVVGTSGVTSFPDPTNPPSINFYRIEVLP